jgi:hypothetical protein
MGKIRTPAGRPSRFALGGATVPGPRFDPKRKKKPRANVRLEEWMWDEIEAIAEESDGALSQNDVHNELMAWALSEYRKLHPKRK